MICVGDTTTHGGRVLEGSATSTIDGKPVAGVGHKPGVGWMLYLPKVITAQQVPEARELIPVPEAGRLQTGTIIVSVPDAAFSVDNSEYVEVANRIEIRLVDQDLLPTFADL
ncbi:immunity 52 family protein [Burkholderia sp. AU32262]|nr:immunity 52 family protein [Burkholderia sp. AU36459]MCA8239976.1 immunity 52 family protein [Burkholderia sp. AU32262]